MNFHRAMAVAQTYEHAKQRMFDLDNPEPLERSLAGVIYAADLMADALLENFT